MVPLAQEVQPQPWVLTGTGGGEHGQRRLLLAVLLVPAHKLLLTLQDAEVRGYCCIEDIVHPCRKEGALSFASPIGGPRRVCRLHSTELCVSLLPRLYHRPHKPRTVPHLLLQTTNRIIFHKKICMFSLWLALVLSRSTLMQNLTVAVTVT